MPIVVVMMMAVAGIRPTDLKPSNIRHTVTRQYYQANAHVVRYYESLRVVYQVESRVSELRSDEALQSGSQNGQLPSIPSR